MTAPSYIQSYATFCDKHIVENMLELNSYIQMARNELQSQSGVEKARNFQTMTTVALAAVSIAIGSCWQAPQFSSCYAITSSLIGAAAFYIEGQEQESEVQQIACVATIILVAQRIFPCLALIISGLAAGAAAFFYGAVEHAFYLHEQAPTPNQTPN